MYIKGLMLFFRFFKSRGIYHSWPRSIESTQQKKVQFASYLCYLITIHLFEEDLYAHSHN